MDYSFCFPKGRRPSDIGAGQINPVQRQVPS